MRIFVISQSEVIGHTGGAISVFGHFCNMLDKAGYEVYAMCWSESTAVPSYLNERIHFVNLRYVNGGQSRFSRSLRFLIDTDKPDLLVFFFPFLYTYAHLPGRYDSIPRILMFHSRPDFYFAQKHNPRLSLSLCYRNTVSQILLGSFKDLLPRFIRKGPVTVIPNYVAGPDVLCDYSATRKRIVYLSRIDPRKGIDLLIDAFALLHPMYPDWSVDVWGESETEEYLEKMKSRVESNGLEGSFFFRGVTRETLKAMLDYDFCAFPSRFEGFSLGLAEAMSLGLPCVGLKSCTGVNELVLDGVNGILCDDDPQSFARGMEKLMLSQELRAEMGKKAGLYMEQFSESVYEQKWLSLIHDILEHGKARGCCSNRSADVRKLVRL